MYKSFVIVFIDESGLKDVCNCVALGAVAFASSRGATYLELGRHLVDNIKRMLRIGGELKWRAVKRRGNPEAVIALIEKAAELRYTAFHYKTPEGFLRELEELARDAALAVLDNQLLHGDLRPGFRYVERDSRRTPGIQLADVVAGYYRERLCGGRRVML
ncbi:hypothetical protein P186_1522 [Pyrobaculum ferrireducens]|uniref:DUF3800 domain-containing protein n=1 Tax=Pyrobaculum ferrireducens TaxID=1104324 RepID=G7VFD5_9CREN|nr:hypothetical protein P186_1522 [Pyrobaculum ferrireducens]